MLEEINDSNACRRRKTLSSNEINNFLSSLATADSENVPPNFTVVETNEKVKLHDFYPTKVEIHDNATENNAPIEPTAEELIRMFCKISYKRINEQNDFRMLCDIGKKIVETTKYKLLPSRSIYPQLFPHLISTIEGKRSLLMSLTPMLTEGEGQRQLEVTNCESFTRCKCEKSRKVNSSYEYVDIDTNLSVPSDKYEKKYLTYIYRNKVKYIPPKPNNSITTETINANNMDIEIKSTESAESKIVIVGTSEYEPNELIVDIVSPMTNINNYKLRRHTLSPASARAHMYDAIEAEADEGNTKLTNSTDDIVVAELGRELDNILANIDDVSITCDNDINDLADSINNNNNDDNINDVEIVVLEETILHNHDSTVDLNAIINDNFNQSADIITTATTGEDIFIQEVIQDVNLNISPDIKNYEEIVELNNNEVKIVLVDSNTEIIDESSQSSRALCVNQIDISDEIAESKAHARLFIRFEQARWRYQWELVSHQCIKKVYELNKYCL